MSSESDVTEEVRQSRRRKPRELSGRLKKLSFEEKIKAHEICGRHVNNESIPMNGCDLMDNCKNCKVKVTKFIEKDVALKAYAESQEEDSDESPREKRKLQEILEIVKLRDLWDTELSAKTNYRLLQDRFERIEKMLEEVLKEEKVQK